MRVCPNCHSDDNSDDVQFCRLCGAYLLNHCTGEYCICNNGQEAELQPDARYCDECGCSSTFNDSGYFDNDIKQPFFTISPIDIYRNFNNLYTNGGVTMKYLWDLEITDFPLAWQGVYDEALTEYPEGMHYEYEYFEDAPVTIAFTDPVGYYNQSIKLFNEYKSKATSLIALKDNYSMPEFISKLITIDAMLYNLIIGWLLPDEGDGYDPQKLSLDTFSVDEYIMNFSSSIPEEFRFIDELKILNPRNINLHSLY